MTKKYEILGKYIKDLSSETRDVQTYLFVKEHIGKYQLNIDPRIFPELATIKSIFFSNKLVNNIVVKTISEDKGNIVAAKKLIIKSFK